ncbi:lysine--tRNA ligase [Microvirga massiliensis]|uniref:lysine--tRNA ligase n=1 Tax=Microvirga massiliensis TaxID=1033741 RepID=UPI00062B5211|nr:lysine--tRNA ligase [Microvirga massiliensis]
MPTGPFDPALVEAAQTATAWPFEEARKLIERLKRTGKKEIVFETGYGPSGLPHIGTFGEVARTSMVRHAFRILTNDAVPTRLVAFSDDLDGLRKVPENIPNKELVAGALNKPLTEVPDPFGTHESFGHHNNARLRAFLDAFGFDYEFLSATECYRAGHFDRTLLTVLERYDAVMAIMLPSLRSERQQTYSPFLPIHPRTGHVMQVPIEERKLDGGTIVWRDPESRELFETPVTGGHAKLQWKPDWAMRWVALGVDYEMAGKDLIDSVKLSGEIARALGGMPPEGFNYELFLDEHGSKISKSKGNGLTIEEWLDYGTQESLALFMFSKPREAKRLYFDVIPRQVDDYLTFLEKFPGQDVKARLANPVWHIHAGAPPAPELISSGSGGQPGTSISYSMLLNLAAVANSEDPAVLWGFFRRYAPGVSPETHPRLDQLVHRAIRYYQDFVKPQKSYRLPDEVEATSLKRLSDALAVFETGQREATPEAIQEEIYNVGRTESRYQDLKAKGATPERPGVSIEWFNTIYQVLLGEPRGPRFGSFIALYGVPETRRLIEQALAGDLVREHEAFRAERLAGGRRA